MVDAIDMSGGNITNAFVTAAHTITMAEFEIIGDGLIDSTELTGAFVDATGDLAANVLDSDAYVDASIDPIHIATHTRSMYWGAGAMEVDGTQCSAPVAVLLHATGPKPLTIACADSDSGTISGSTVMPDGWDGSTVIFEIALGQIAAATTVFDMDFEGQCIGTTEDFLTFAGTGEVQATVTLVADDDHLTALTTAVTLNGSTCAAWTRSRPPRGPLPRYRASPSSASHAPWHSTRSPTFRR